MFQIMPETDNGQKRHLPLLRITERCVTMFYDNEDFYHTPAELANKMVAMADLKRVHFVLELSAGKGDLVTTIENKMRYAGYG